MNPLHRVGSLKFKLGLLIVLAIGTTALTMLAASYLDVRLRYGALAALLTALVVVQVAARGTTAPLRAMNRAAGRIAGGEHGVRVAVAGRDEVAQLGDAFNAMAAELEVTDRIRRDLVADAAHELRTPVAALQAVLENAADGVGTADPEELLVQVRRLAALADELLDLSRLEAGAATIDRDPVDVPALVAGALSAGPPIRPPVTVDVPDGLELRGDRDRLLQVLANLLENARRHAPGTPVVVRARGRPAGGVRIEVEDRGPGLPAADAERVFERFARGDHSRTAPGSGLGLSIARSIVELHGGSVRAEPADPHGCRMVLELP